MACCDVQVPPFLHFPEPRPGGSYSGVFRHKTSQGSVEALTRWWPPSLADIHTVVLFIPGNPGLIEFYVPFLSALHRSFPDDGLAIIAHAHLGHTPHLNVPKTLGLTHQVEAALETFDAIKACWPDAKVVLVGHSVGSWIATQLLKLRPDHMDALFMLFPTISDIARTPNGRRLSWLFHMPVVSAISRLSVLIRPISAPVLSLLFPSWPAHQRTVLRSLVCSPPSIFASLTMAHDEMRTITTLDAPLLNKHLPQLWLYYAERDDWVGKEREKIVASLGEPAAPRIVHCKHGIPHAFCILHSDLIAAQCADWLKKGGFCGQTEPDVVNNDNT